MCSLLQKWFCILIFSHFSNFEFRIFIIMLKTMVYIRNWLNIGRLHFDSSVTCCFATMTSMIYCIGLRPNTSKNFWNALVIVIPFFVFQQNHPCVFAEISIIHSKNLTTLFYLLINCMSARLAPQMLARKDIYILHLLNFLVMGLYNPLANCISSEIFPVP